MNIIHCIFLHHKIKLIDPYISLGLAWGKLLEDTRPGDGHVRDGLNEKDDELSTS